MLQQKLSEQPRHKHRFRIATILAGLELLLILLLWHFGQPTQTTISHKPDSQTSIHGVADQSINRSATPSASLTPTPTPGLLANNSSSMSSSTPASGNSPPGGLATPSQTNTTPGISSGNQSGSTTSTDSSTNNQPSQTNTQQPLKATMSVIKDVITVNANQPLKDCTFIIQTPTGSQTFHATPQGDTCTLTLSQLLSILGINVTVESISGQITHLTN